MNSVTVHVVQSHCTQIILGPICLCDLCCASHWALAAIAAPESLLQKPQFTWPSFTKGQQQRDWWFSYTSERSQQPSFMGNRGISPLNMKKKSYTEIYYDSGKDETFSHKMTMEKKKHHLLPCHPSTCKTEGHSAQEVPRRDRKALQSRMEGALETATDDGSKHWTNTNQHGDCQGRISPTGDTTPFPLWERKRFANSGKIWMKKKI